MFEVVKTLVAKRFDTLVYSWEAILILDIHRVLFTITNTEEMVPSFFGAKNTGVPIGKLNVR